MRKGGEEGEGFVFFADCTSSPFLLPRPEDGRGGVGAMPKASHATPPPFVIDSGSRGVVRARGRPAGWPGGAGARPAAGTAGQRNRGRVIDKIKFWHHGREEEGREEGRRRRRRRRRCRPPSSPPSLGSPGRTLDTLARRLVSGTAVGVAQWGPARWRSGDVGHSLLRPSRARPPWRAPSRGARRPPPSRGARALTARPRAASPRAAPAPRAPPP